MHVYYLLKKTVIIFFFLFSVVECTVKWGTVRGKVIRNSILKIWFTGKWWQLAFSFIGRNIQRKGNKNIFMSPLSHVVVCFVFFQFNKIPWDNLTLHINGKIRDQNKRMIFVQNWILGLWSFSKQISSSLMLSI